MWLLATDGKSMAIIDTNFMQSVAIASAYFEMMHKLTLRRISEDEMKTPLNGMQLAT